MTVGAMRLDWGDLDLVNADGGYGSYSFAALGEDVDFGEPRPVEQVIASLMADGEPTEMVRWENREATFRVEVEAADSGGLADGEGALTSMLGRRTTLAWTPPDGWGPTTVFDVETSRMKFLFSGLDEARQIKRRYYQLVLTCLPFGRSETPVVVGSEFVSDDVTIEDECESTTGWSVYGSGQSATMTVDSTAGHFVSGTGAVKFIVEPYLYDAPNYVTASTALVTANIRKTGLSIDASGGGYFKFRHRPEPGWVLDLYNTTVYLTTSGGGRQEATIVSALPDDNGYTDYSVTIPHLSTIQTFELEANQTSGPYAWGSQPANPGWWFDAIGIADASTSNQQARSFDVEGSVRTEGSFAISAPAGLGDVLLYTCPDLGDSFRPDLRRWQTSGATTSDVAAINGSYTALSGSPVLKAPASIFRKGAYGVLARLDDASTITVTAQVEIDGVLVGQAQTVTSPTVSVTDYTVIRVGVLDLPPLAVGATSGALVKFSLSGSGKLDELLVFPLEDAALTWVACGSGSPSATVASRLWLDEPSPAQPRGARLVGNSADRVDARYSLASSRGRHLLSPGRNFAYLLSSAAGGAAMQVTYYPRSHSNNAYQPVS